MSYSFKTSRKLQAILLATALSSSVTVFAQQKETIAKPSEMVGALHSAFGKHPGARAVHAKGIILEGTFTPTPEARTLTTAVHFKQKQVPVIVRFSDFTGIPDISDLNGLSNPRGLAIKFLLPDGQSTDIVSHSFDGFPVATTDEFRTLLLAIGTSGADAPKPTDLDKFLGTHPVAVTFLTTQKAPSVSFGTLDYFGVNAFEFTNKKGEKHFIRYQFIPESGEQFLTADELKTKDKDYLNTEIKQRIATQTIKYKLYAQVAESGDPVTNPSIAWPVSRKKVLLGTIEIKKLADNSVAEDKKLFFIPNNIPTGIAVADQMLSDRSKAYPISVAERQQAQN